jgi:ADP-heptose:LPS heptosyltransferase
MQALAFDPGFIVIEPNVKRSAPNKQWPQDRYARVAELLMARGHELVQFETGGVVLPGVRQVRALNFRMAASILSRAALYIGPEGGLHHAAAALDVNIPAVVNFGGFISPRVTGYKKHTNIFGSTDLGCGQITPCTHCQKIMQRITVEQVLEASLKTLRESHEKDQRILLAGSRGALGLVSGEGADVRRWPDVPAPQVAGGTTARQELQERD